jgi:DNA-directed RNA polymerase subunit RPC12/RpoP
MYRCNKCQFEFEEPETEKTSYEAYYGVCCQFSNSTPLTLYKCPNCNEENSYSYFDENEEFEDEEEE